MSTTFKIILGSAIGSLLGLIIFYNVAVHADYSLAPVMLMIAYACGAIFTSEVISALSTLIVKYIWKNID